MPVFEVEHPDGTYEVEAPDFNGATAAVKNHFTPSWMDTGAGLAKAAGTGVMKGAIGLAGLPGDLRSLVGSGMDYFAPPRDPRAPDYNPPSSADIESAVKSKTGEFHQPQTKAEQYAQSVGEFVPGMAVGVGPGLKAATGAIAPGLFSQGAADVANKYAPGFEPYARFAGGVLGGVGTAAGGAAARGVGNYYQRGNAAEDLTKIVEEPISRGAVSRVASDVEADALTPQSAAAAAGKYGGNDAMLLDMGRQLQQRAEAIAQQPGKGQNTVLNAVEGRTGEFGSGTAARVKDTLNDKLGPSPNVVTLRDDMHKLIDERSAPAYEKVMSDHPNLWDSQLEALSKRPAIASAIKDAGSIAANYGKTLDQQPSLRNWDYVKKNLDARIKGLMKNGGVETLNSEQKADLGGMIDARNSLRNHLDELTGGAYAGARKIAAEKPQLDEALDYGRGVFNKNILTEEAKREFDEMSIPEQGMARSGMRREVEKVIDAARNDGAAARRFLDTNSNREKIRTFFGNDAADALDARIAAETHHQDVTNKVSANSRTYLRSQIGEQTKEPELGELPEVTATGLLLSAGKKGLNYAVQHGVDRTREGIANMLTSTGDKRDAIAKVLSEYNAKKFKAPERPELVTPRAKGLAAALLSGAGR